MFPNDLSRSGLQGIDSSVRCTKNHSGLTVQNSENRRTIGCVFWSRSGAHGPDWRAGRFVHRDESMRWDGCLIPAGRDPGYDHHVFKNSRKIRPTAIGGKHSILLEHRFFPENLTGLPLKALQHAADAEHINIVGIRITHKARPTDPLRRCVGQINVVNALPNQFACLRIYTNSFFGFLRCLGFRTTNSVDSSIHDNGSCSRRKGLLSPNQILAVYFERVWKPLLQRLTVLHWPSPLVPITSLFLVPR